MATKAVLTKAGALKKSLENKYPPIEAGVSDWQGWTNFNAFCKTNDITRRTLVRLVDEGGYTCFTCPDGTIRIPPDAEEQLELDLGDEAEDEAEETAETADMATVLGQCTAMLRTANEFIEKLLSSVVKPLELTTRTNEEMMKRTLARLSELENKRDELVTQREALLNEEAERRFAQTRIEAEEKRKDEAWSEVLKLTPVLGEQLKNTLGRWGGKDRQALEAAMALLSSLDPEQLALLGNAELGFLKPDQRERLSVLVQHLPKKDGPPPPPPDKEPTPAAAEPPPPSPPAEEPPPPPTKAESPKPKRKAGKPKGDTI